MYSNAVHLTRRLATLRRAQSGWSSNDWVRATVRSDEETGVTDPEKGEAMTTVTTDSLEDKLQRLGNPAEWLRNVPLGPYAYPKKTAEFTNWRDEQRAWRDDSRRSSTSRST